MINRFKFLTNNDEPLDIPIYDIEYGFASWMWANPHNVDRHWEVERMTTTGIRSFLTNFPEQMIVPILSITGNNITMTIENENNGWPFDILGGTELQIVYLRWIPE